MKQKNDRRLVLIIFGLVVLFLYIFLTNLLCCGPAQYSKDPKSVIHMDLEKIYSQGYGITNSKEIYFDPNIPLYGNEVIGKIGIKESEMAFGCEGSICDKFFLNTQDFETSTNFASKESFNASMVVCGDDSRTQGPRYCIGFGKQGDEAERACRSRCRLT